MRLLLVEDDPKISRFLLKGLGTTQGSATAAVSVTLLGTAWVGFGLGADPRRNQPGTHP